MSIFTYYLDCLVAFILNTLIWLRKRILATPDEICHIPSREAGRCIKAHVYRASPPVSGPTPVLLNWHGSGFVFALHGHDDEFCRQVCRETQYTVFDLHYRLAPQNPFPAALHDVEDTINYVLERPEEFDLSRVSLSGFSAGANLAIAAASNLFPPDTFRSLLAFYPPLDLSRDPSTKTAPVPEHSVVAVAAARFFNRCYVRAGVDKRDPRISPRFASPERFPRRVLMITADGDSLAPEAEELAERLQAHPERYVVSQRMQGCRHAWDKRTRTGTPQHAAKDHAYGLAVAMLNE